MIAKVIGHMIKHLPLFLPAINLLQINKGAAQHQEYVFGVSRLNELLVSCSRQSLIRQIQADN